LLNKEEIHKKKEEKAQAEKTLRESERGSRKKRNKSLINYNIRKIICSRSLVKS
jgi:hypothetical protein